ncbi:phosphate ABC transporter substrate-binding protein PstS [Sphaerotilaceae bacterium SBD11-9]
MERVSAAAVIAAFLLAGSGLAHADIQGAGASFPSKVYATWSDTYQRDAGVRVAYKPTGSGDGVKQITERAVAFAGSDTPLPPAELAKRKLVQFPTVVGGIVPVVHLPGLGERGLQLDGGTLAEIQLGGIARWDDPRIAELNKGVRLPALPIQRIVRAEKSGTTEGYTRYLSQVSAAFKTQVGDSQLPKWPGAVVAAEGNDGMVRALKATPGAIAYVSYDRVVNDRLADVRLRNAAGQFVRASETGFRSAIRESELGRTGNDLASLLDRPGVETWPITTATFALLDANPKAADAAAPALRFLYWCFLHGDDLTRGTGFAPLPIVVQARIAARFASVKAQDGRALHYLSY